MTRTLTAAFLLLFLIGTAATPSDTPHQAASPSAVPQIALRAAGGNDSTRPASGAVVDSLKSLEKLVKDISALVNLKQELGSGNVGIEVRSLSTNKVIYSLNSDKPLTPASTTKVVTTFTALAELGPDYMVKTVVAADARPRDGVVKGNLYVKGYGDPFLSINEIDLLVDQLLAAGIKQVDGNIVGDGSFFDGKTERTQYSGDEDVVVPLPPIAALTLDRSTFTVIVSSPRTAGQPLNVQTYPHSAGFEIVNNGITAETRRAPAKRPARGRKRADLPAAPSGTRILEYDGATFGDESPLEYADQYQILEQRKPAKRPAATASKRNTKTQPAKSTPVKGKTAAKKTTTAPKKTAADKPPVPRAEEPAVAGRGPLKVSLATAENGKQTITVNGSLAPNRTVSYRYQMKNPPLIIAGIIYDRLRSHGIVINGVPTSGVTPARHRLLAEAGRPLAEILQLVMKNSNNFLAEYVFKMIGAAAGGQQETAEKSVEKIEYRMSLNRIPFGRCIINDGSGLSRANCLSATSLNGILEAAHRDKKVFDPFYSTMSIAGVDGTLRKRMKGTFAEGNVHGKTGTLRNVSALAGYVTTRDGELLCFSMLMNGGNHGAYRTVQDKIASRLAAFSYREQLASTTK